MDKKLINNIILALIFILSLFFSFFAGKIHTKLHIHSIEQELSIIDDVNIRNCMVSFEKLEGNRLFGKVENHKVVIKAKDTLFEINKDNTFSIDLGQLFNIARIDDFKYVGSSQSKVFHNIDSTSGCAIKADNKVFFRSYDDAIVSGFLPSKNLNIVD